MSTPVAQTLFLGASISRFDVNIGWGSQETSLTISLVEDTFTTTTKTYWSSRVGNSPVIYSEAQTTTAADSFSPPDVGSPVYFRIGDFAFSGVLQGWAQEESTGGKPVYSVTVVSPNAILNGVRLITGGYSGSVQSMTNILNCYGYWENQGFGLSGYNEAGMPWEKIKDAVVALVASSSVGTYGGSIRWNGINYGIDLSNLPEMPDFYRGDGSNDTSLLDFVATLCRDASYDFIVDMYFSANAPIIRIKTVSRRSQPNTGLLNAYLLSLTGVSQKSRGIEARNEPVKAFVVGGTIEQIDTDSYNGQTNANASIWPYWGINSSGNLILGTGLNDEHKFTIDMPKALQTDGWPETYDVTVGELRAAKIGISEWQDFVAAIDETKKTTFEIEPRIDPFTLTTQVDARQPLDPWNVKAARVEEEGDLTLQEKLQSLYELIKTYADDFYGRKFMVKVNNLEAKTDPETGAILYSLEPIDAGYLSETNWNSSTMPLHLPSTGIDPVTGTWATDKFTTIDGRFESFVSFNNVADDHDTKYLDPEVSLELVDEKKIWVKSQADPGFVFVQRTGYVEPRVVITLASPVYKKTETGALDESRDLLRILYNIGKNVDPFDDLSVGAKARIEKALKAPNALNLAYHAACIMPTGVAVPLRYHKRSYGPWYIGSVDGQVRFEQDPSLVPWNYNGYTYLNVAGNAKITESLSQMISTETGTVELPGVPSIGIGDALVSGGPSVTNMSVSVGVDGVKTFYRMQTYTPTFGAVAKQAVEKVQRMISGQQQLRRRDKTTDTQQITKSINDRVEAISKAKTGKDQFGNKSPHTVLVGQLEDLGNGKTKIATTTSKNDEALNAIQPDVYGNSAVLSLDNFLAPYSTNLAGTTGFPHFEVPHSGFLNTNTSISLNPYWGGPSGYKNTSISGYPNTSMITSSGTHPASGLSPNVTHGFYAQNVRGVGLKGPLVLTSWGYGIDGKMWPSGQTDRFMDHEFKQKPHMWKSGPVDLWWDDYRKVWTGTAMYKAISNGNGTYQLGLSENAHGKMHHAVTITPTEWIGGGYVPSGNRAIVASVQGQLLVISAEC